jgi:hypothetical protein
MAVGQGLLTVCQLPLTDAALAGDPLALALLSDLVRWPVKREMSETGADSATSRALPDH